MATRIQLRRGTASQWTTANPTLAEGEIGLETNTGRFKFGDGLTAWTSLGYGGEGGTADWGDIGGTLANQSDLAAALATKQAASANLSTYSGITPSSNVQAILAAANYAAIRTLLGLVIGTDVQAYSSVLATWAATNPSANAQSLVTAANYAAMRALLDLEAGTDFYSISATDAAIAAAVSGLYDIKGSTNCSANPNYPSASKGDVYFVSAAGKIGGASGKVVEVGDSYVAIADNAGGTEASVGTSWVVAQGNVAFSSNGLSLVTAADYGAMLILLGLSSADDVAFSTVNAENGLTAGTGGLNVDADGNLDLSAGLYIKINGVNVPTTSLVGARCEIGIACSDETTALTTGTAKATFRMPYAMTLTAVRASVTTAPTGTGNLTIDINESGTTVLSTKLTFDASEKTTTTAATPAVISDSALADDAEITIDIDAVSGTITGAGLKVWLIGTRA